MGYQVFFCFICQWADIKQTCSIAGYFIFLDGALLLLHTPAGWFSKLCSCLTCRRAVLQEPDWHALRIGDPASLAGGLVFESEILPHTPAGCLPRAGQSVLFVPDGLVILFLVRQMFGQRFLLLLFPSLELLLVCLRSWFFGWLFCLLLPFLQSLYQRLHILRLGVGSLCA